MIERVLVLSENIRRVLNLNGNEKYLDRCLTNNEITDLGDLIRVIKPFDVVTEKLSGEKFPTRSIIVPSMKMLYKNVNIILNLSNILLVFIF